MDGSIRLPATERNALLQVYRMGAAGVSRRAHIVLLLDDGWTFREIRAVTYSSFQLIARAARLYRSGGVDAVWRRPGRTYAVTRDIGSSHARPIR